MQSLFLLQQVFALLLTVFIVIVISFIYFKLTRKKRLEQIEKDSKTITDGIEDLYSFRTHLRPIIQTAFNFSDEEDSPDFSLPSKIQTKVRMDVKDRFFAPISYIYQEVFDEILRMYATDMEDAYGNSDGIKKNINGKNSQFFMQLSAEEIDRLLRTREDNERKKKKLEKKFWEFHDTIKKFGFRTWGDKGSYKIYLLLRPYIS